MPGSGEAPGTISQAAKAVTGSRAISVTGTRFASVFGWPAFETRAVAGAVVAAPRLGAALAEGAFRGLAFAFALGEATALLRPLAGGFPRAFDFADIGPSR